MGKNTMQRSQSAVLVSLTKNEAYYNEATTSIDTGKVMATAPEALLSREFTRENEQTLRDSRVFVSYENAPTETGYHKIDFKNNRLVKISDEEASALKWYEKVFVYESVLYAVKEKRPLALGFDNVYYNGDWLDLVGVYYRSDAFRVAQRDANRDKIKKQQQNKDLLRVDQGKAVVLTHPSGKRKTINVPEGTIVSLE
ncbi:MAG: hypothetical protein KGH60_01665 [Candidatus Micrarchaeota archaeon]|nr:hypothetical protein [Candidatus Micrarchaeota archaeon]